MRLSTGKRIENAFALARRKFERFGWPLYDGVRSDPNRIEIIDYVITAAMNSRANARGLQNVMLAASEITRCLREVPERMELVDLDPDTEVAVGALIARTARVGGVGISVATKILHRKRPLLIPMMDQVVQYHYKSLLGRLPQERGARALAYIRAIAADVRTNESAIRELKSVLVKKRCVPPHASCVRLFEATLYQWLLPA